MNNKGLTLIEIIISVLIIVIISAGVLSAFVGGHQLMNRSRHRLQALNFAREALDRLRANYQYDDLTAMYNCSSLTDYCHPEAHVAPNPNKPIIRDEMDTLNGAILTYNVTEPEVNGYKRVSVRIYWTEAAF